MCDPPAIVWLFTQALFTYILSFPPLAVGWASSCLEYHIPELFKLSH